MSDVRGINLGGWLVLEKWMTPSLFEGTTARDETQLCVQLGKKKATEKLHNHWNTFITEEDFKWLASIGINTVRIPVGYWVLGDGYPYHRRFQFSRYPFVQGGIYILDRAFNWAEKYGMRVLIDLHCAPGCQNGFDNGGMCGVVEWHTTPGYALYTLDVLERLAERYAGRKGLYGIESLNEPHWDVPTKFLRIFNLAAYQRIRKHCDESVAFVYHDGFRSYKEFERFESNNNLKNAVLDVHRYRCFAREDIDSDIYTHISGIAKDWKQEADDMINARHQVILGEWSLGLDLKVVSLWAEGPYNNALDHMDSFQANAAYRAYGAAQLLTFEKYSGWFYWSYKTETTPAWCFRDCVNAGWLPGHFGRDTLT